MTNYHKLTALPPNFLGKTNQNISNKTRKTTYCTMMESDRRNTTVESVEMDYKRKAKKIHALQSMNGDYT